MPRTSVSSWLHTWSISSARGPAENKRTLALLQQQPPAGSPSDILHGQYWVVGKIKTMRPAVYTFDCSGLHDFELEEPTFEVPWLGPSHIVRGRYRAIQPSVREILRAN